MKRILIACLLLSTTAFADDFANRIAEAKKASATQEGKTYDQALGSAIGTAMRTCVPPGSTSQANLGDFILVGYVDKGGVISSVELRPKTEISTCFAAHFAQERLMTPPEHGASPLGYPIVVEMSVHP